jgi:serine/threonine protein kinase
MIGQRLLHYEIVEKLGEGGMGVVYKARDAHLDRFVAIKVLPPEKVADAGRKARFVQEAKSASALNHPNIVVVHDIASDGGTDFIAMEFVGGRTLDQLIPRKGMRLNDALKIAVQIADALTKAHVAGIVHRDLKPGNLMVTGDGLVKVLDFGLAKLTETALSEDEATRTAKPHTEEGTVVGTAAYMSPEQAEGKPVDARSDIFSFGAVLYETVTGARAFRGDSRMSTLAAVLHNEPTPMGAEVPRELERIIRRCLRKDPARRFQHMDDVKIALEEMKEESESGVLAAIPQVKRPSRARWLTVLLLPLIAVAGVWLGLRFYGRTGEEQPLRAVPLTSLPGWEKHPSFSPDGAQLAFVWDGPRQDNDDIYVMMVGSDDPQRRTSDPAADTNPAWSPDGRSIAFLRWNTSDSAAVITIPSIGGPERKLAAVWPPIESWVAPPHLAWSGDGRHLVLVHKASAGEPYALFSLSVESGEVRRLTSPPPGTIGDGGPAISPDGLSLAFGRMAVYLMGDLYRLPVDRDLTRRGVEKRVTAGITWPRNPAWTTGGKSIVFESGQYFNPTLWRVDPSGSGTPRRVPLAAGVWGTDFTISRDGGRLALSHSTDDSEVWTLDLTKPPRDATARLHPLNSTRHDRYAEFSPDGRRIVFISERSGNAELWVSSADGTGTLRLTSFANPEFWPWKPRWSPDGKFVVVSAHISGRTDTYIVDAGGGSVRRLPIGDALASGWSSDGRYIYFFPGLEARKQVWKLPLAGGDPAQVTQGGGAYAIESPDGKLLYFTRNWPGQSTLWSMPVGGGPETQVVESVGPMNFEVGREDVYFRVRQRVLALNTRTRAIREVAALPQRTAFTFSVAPDGSMLLYGAPDPARRNSDILLVENFR